MNNLKTKYFKKGFSIIEVIIAVGIVAIISTVIIDIYLKNTTNYKIQQSQSQLQVKSRYALDTINSWIKKSSSVISSYTAPDSATYQTTASRLVLEVPSVDENDNVIPDKYDYIIIRIDPADSLKLMQIIYADAESSRTSATKEIARYLENIQFTYYNSSGNTITSNYEDSVSIKSNIILSEILSSKTTRFELNTKTKLRNK